MAGAHYEGYLLNTPHFPGTSTPTPGHCADAPKGRPKRPERARAPKGSPPSPQCAPVRYRALGGAAVRVLAFAGSGPLIRLSSAHQRGTLRMLGITTAMGSHALRCGTGPLSLPRER